MKAYIDWLRARHLSVHTVKYHQSYIRLLMRWLDERQLTPREMTPATLNEYQQTLAKKNLKASTLDLQLKTLKSFFTWLYRENLIGEDLSRRLVYPKLPDRLPNVLTETEVDKLLGRPDTRTAKGIRDKAILELLYSAGIRQDELLSLNLYDYHERERMIRVIGKGRKERMVPVGRIAAQWIEAYLNNVRKYYAQDKETALFITLRYGRRIARLHLSEYQEEITFTPHTLRHSFATHMLKAGADTRHVQRFLGHSTIGTTEVYTHLDKNDLKKIVQKAHPRGTKKPTNR